MPGTAETIHRLRLITTSRVSATRYEIMASQRGIKPVRHQMVPREIIGTRRPCVWHRCCSPAASPPRPKYMICSSERWFETSLALARVAPATPDATNTIARNNKPLPRKTVREEPVLVQAPSKSQNYPDEPQESNAGEGHEAEGDANLPPSWCAQAVGVSGPFGRAVPEQYDAGTEQHREYDARLWPRRPRRC